MNIDKPMIKKPTIPDCHLVYLLVRCRATHVAGMVEALDRGMWGMGPGEVCLALQECGE